MTNVDLGGSQEFGNAKAAFHSKPNRATARQYLLAWADQTMGKCAPTTPAALLRRLAHDDDYCLAYVDAEMGRVKRAWADVVAAAVKMEAARDKVSSEH